MHFAIAFVHFAMRATNAASSAPFANPPQLSTSSTNHMAVRPLHCPRRERCCSWSCSREICGLMHCVTSACRRLIRAFGSLLTWILVGTATGLVVAAVFGLLCGVIYGVIQGELAVVIAVMLYTARA